ncbi:hypothetical protein K505DRAFT_67083 [Melanomma pulvis-pyrius CBS 109.77]|uniref:Uncharacterized protein n=1 Tax=Melanomma pulvis-pyrius CBS 109.77 TaxID=1314802 RepID=A0A6A6X4C5_9PLEO|nr:hypothetical protein K505DRAFT_67083 [Melanomma pulvis-pyrius CBS 109.77]
MYSHIEYLACVCLSLLIDTNGMHLHTSKKMIITPQPHTSAPLPPTLLQIKALLKLFPPSAANSRSR